MSRRPLPARDSVVIGGNTYKFVPFGRPILECNSFIWFNMWSVTVLCIREVFWNARKSMWKIILSCDSFYPFFSKWEKSGISKKEVTLYGKKIGHFEKNARDQFWNRKETENEILRFSGISEKMVKSYHMTKSSFTCFSGHFKILPVLVRKYVLPIL